MSATRAWRSSTPALGRRASSCRRRCGSSTSPGSSAAPRTARGSVTSSSADPLDRCGASTCCAASATRRSPIPAGSVDPLGDVETVELELAFADLAAIERRHERVAKAAKGGDRDAVAEGAGARGDPRGARGGPAGALGRVESPATLDLLTAKPTLYLANVDDSGNAADVAAVEAFAAERGAPCVAVNAKIEAELRELPEDDAGAFLDDLGIESPALDRVTLATYRLLDLIPFFTTGPEGDAGVDDPARPERQQAAGRIHTDLARGFIRAEVIEWDRLVEAGSEVEAKRRGWVRVEGRDYVVADGDALNVRFNV